MKCTRLKTRLTRRPDGPDTMSTNEGMVLTILPPEANGDVGGDTGRGDGFRVKVGALQSTLESAPPLQALLNRYAAIRGMQVAQTAGCNRLHDLKAALGAVGADASGQSDSGALPITLLHGNKRMVDGVDAQCDAVLDTYFAH
jgi:hypothetical protein